MPTLIITPSSASANAYCSVAEADAYAETILHAEAWNEAETLDKEKAILYATRMMDDLCEFAGAPSSSSQALKWPRRGVLTRISATGGGSFYHHYVRTTGGILNEFGVELPYDTIPQFLKDATAELARTLLISDRVSEQDSANVSSIAIPGLTIGYLGSGSNSKRKLISPTVYQMIAFYATYVYGHTNRRVVRA